MRMVISSLALLTSLLLTITSCTPAESGSGTINVVVTSDIIGQGEAVPGEEIEISSIGATISEIKVYSGGLVLGEEDEQGKWVDLYLANKPINLLQNSSQEQFLAFADVAAASYDELVMVIDRLNVMLSDGSKITITPNDVFDFVASFVVYPGKTTTVIFRFNIDKSVTYTDENQTIIKPLAGIILNVRYEEIE